MNLQQLRRQQARETKSIRRGLRQGKTQGLSGSLALEANAGLEKVVIKDLRLDKVQGRWNKSCPSCTRG